MSDSRVEDTTQSLHADMNKTRPGCRESSGFGLCHPEKRTSFSLPSFMSGDGGGGKTDFASTTGGVDCQSLKSLIFMERGFKRVVSSPRGR